MRVVVIVVLFFFVSFAEAARAETYFVSRTSDMYPVLLNKPPKGKIGRNLYERARSTLLSAGFEEVSERPHNFENQACELVPYSSRMYIACVRATEEPFCAFLPDQIHVNAIVHMMKTFRRACPTRII